MGNRTYTCLVCGKTVTVSSEEYSAVKQNPVCNECLVAKNKVNKVNVVPDKTDDVSDFINLAGRAVGVIAKSVSVIKDKDKKTEDKNITDTITKGFCNTGRLTNVEKDLFQEDDISFDSGWEKLGCLGKVYESNGFSGLSRSVGLYMHKIDNEIMYIGRAVEYNNGGLRKRLSDYCRPNGSARKHPSGQKIYANRYRIQTYILVVGDDAEAAEKSKRLEELYVGKYNPPWNSKLKTDR